jgi:hypothetical protein
MRDRLRIGYRGRRETAEDDRLTAAVAKRQRDAATTRFVYLPAAPACPAGR